MNERSECLVIQQAENLSLTVPTRSISIAKLSEALSKAQGDFDHAKKDVKNDFFKSNYADLASVIGAAKKPLAANGLAVIQITNFDGTGKMILMTTLSHSSGEWISSVYPINPVKQDPQGIGSALTYARRYSFSAITGIASDDDDGNAASGNSPIPQATAKEVRETSRARNARWSEIKKSLQEAATLDDMQTIWAGNYTHIQAFGAELTDELTREKDKRKDELTQDNALKAGMPEDFNKLSY